MTLSVTQVTTIAVNKLSMPVATHAAHFVMFRSQKILTMCCGYSVTMSSGPLGTMCNVPTSFPQDYKHLDTMTWLCSKCHFWFYSFVFVVSIKVSYIVNSNSQKIFVITVEYIATLSGNSRQCPLSTSWIGQVMRARTRHTHEGGWGCA